jgi:hypothetical protein
MSVIVIIRCNNNRREEVWSAGAVAWSRNEDGEWEAQGVSQRFRTPVTTTRNAPGVRPRTSPRH